MATISLGKRTRQTTQQGAGVRLVIIPQTPMSVLLGGLSDDVTTDHQCAQLQPGITYDMWRTAAGARRLSMLSRDQNAPDDPLPVNDPRARKVDISEV